MFVKTEGLLILLVHIDRQTWMRGKGIVEQTRIDNVVKLKAAKKARTTGEQKL